SSLQGWSRLLQPTMRGVKTGQVIEDVSFQEIGDAGLNHSPGPNLIDLQGARRLVAVETVLRQMDLRMLVAIAHEGHIEPGVPPLPVEATPGRQLFFGELRGQRDQVSVHLV